MIKRNKQQKKYILTKYKNSEKNYRNIYINKKIYLFLNDFDSMNPYPTYPELINLKINLNNTDISNKINLEDRINYDKFNNYIIKLKSIYVKVNNKIKVFHQIIKKYDDKIKNIKKNYKKKYGDINRVRKYFDYEVRDYCAEHLNIKPITDGFLKCYEIIHYFKLIDLDNKKLKTFHICEIPGAFILAINHYIKTKGNNIDFNWNAQSLNPWTTKDKTKFLHDQYGLVRKYKDRYHWGNGSGDITDINNIKYYIKKFKKMDLVTADCGQDVESNFIEQEKILNKVFWSQLVCALGMIKEGGNYITKIFTIQTKKMIEFIYILTSLFDKVYIVKPLKTKSTSGERYVVSMGYKGISDKILDKLIEYLKVFDKKKTLLDVNKISEKFLNKLNKINNLFEYFRITNINQSIFQVYNFEFINENKQITTLNKKMVDYYVEYFIQYYQLEYIKDKDKIL